MIAAMRHTAFFLATILTTTILVAADLTPKDVVTQFYQAHRSHHDPLIETKLLDRYFDPQLLKLYLRDQREAKGEVGRLDGDPLYNAQDMEITHFSIAPAEVSKGEAQVNVRFKNLRKSTHIVYVLTHIGTGWRISDIRYDDASSLKKILQADM